MKQILVLAIVVPALLAPLALASSPHPIKLTERSPLRTWEELCRRSDAVEYWRHMDPKQIDYDISAESFNVFVPSGASRSNPHGLFVWVGVTEFTPSWLDILARHRLIFLDIPGAAKRSQVAGLGLAADAIYNMTRMYNIDANRVYVSGFSGGGLFAAEVVHAFPDLYRGAFFINGEDFYNGRWTEQGKLEPGVREYPPWGGPFDYEKLKKEMRLVIMTGEKDPVFEPDISRMNHEGLLMDGFRQVTYFEIPRGGHNHPDDTWFERGLNALDHPQLKTPPTTAPTNDPNPLPSQIAQARRLLNTAQELIDGPNASWGAGQAPKYLEQLIKDYPTTPAAAIGRELLEWTKHNPAPKQRMPRSVIRPATTAKTTTPSS